MSKNSSETSYFCASVTLEFVLSATFFAESTILHNLHNPDILAHFDILLMLLTAFKYSNLVFTKYILAIYVHEM